jgi:acyl-CoA synthetase (AMP-forming)/AMP-acid ligase II
MRQGLGYLFDSALAATPDRVAVIQGKTTLTFRELDDGADRVAAALYRDGISAGVRIALLIDNDYRFLECYFGALRAAAVVVPINHRLSNDGVSSVLEDSDAGFLIVSQSQAVRLPALRERGTLPERIVSFSAASPGVTAYEAWIGKSPGAPPRVPISDDDVAIQAYTAGSTGKAKGCLLSHGGQLWNLERVLSVVGFTSADRAIVATPVGHKNATMSIKRFLRVGGSVVLRQSFYPEDYLATVERYKVTCMTGVPAMYQMLVARRELLSQHDTRSVRCCFVASAEVPAGLQQALKDYFPNAYLQEIYGATEAGFMLQPVGGARGLVPIPGAGVQVLDEDGRECAMGEVGEITFKNPGVTLGYHRNPELTADHLRGGRYHTGDLGRQNSPGCYQVIGRKDDMIVTGGENVYPKEVEDLLLRGGRLRRPRATPDQGAGARRLRGGARWACRDRGGDQAVLPGARCGVRPSTTGVLSQGVPLVCARKNRSEPLAGDGGVGDP